MGRGRPKKSKLHFEELPEINVDMEEVEEEEEDLDAEQEELNFDNHVFTDEFSGYED